MNIGIPLWKRLVMPWWQHKRLCHYMLYHTTLLKYLFGKPALLGRLARWHLLLAKFDITHVTHKSMKGQAIANHQAENLVEGCQPTTYLLQLMDVF